MSGFGSIAQRGGDQIVHDHKRHIPSVTFFAFLEREQK